MPQRALEAGEKGSTTSTEGCRIEVAAVLEKRTHTAGVGWRLTAPGTVRLAQGRTLLRTGTLIAAELTATREGLRAAARVGCRTVQICIPDARAIAVLRGTSSARLSRARTAADRLKPLLERFASVRFDSDFVPNRELAHTVGEALDAGLQAAAAREEHRVWVMERIVERARSVRLRQRDSGWVANDRYRVQLDPMRCECPAWTARWARVPIGGRRAQRLPCKHLVALALHEGVSVPEDLAQLARRAPA